jgi:Undecaprenyl-phosphate glucose phosphotransferase
MIKRYQNSAGVMTRIADTAIVVTSWLVAYPVRFHLLASTSFLPLVPGIPDESYYLALLPLIILLWGFCFQFFGLYRYDKVIRRSTEIYTLLRAHIATLVLFTSLTYFITQFRFSRGMILVFGVFVFLGCWAFRIISRKILRELNRKGIHSSPLVAVGEGKALEFLLSQLERYPELGVDIVSRVGPESYTQALSIIQKNRPKTVLVSLPREQSGFLSDIVRQLKDEPLDLQIIPDYTDFMALGGTVEDFSGVPLIVLNESPLFGYQAWLKRTFDFVLSGVGLLILSPLFLLTSIFIKLTSTGSVFYRQERMGLDGATFAMWKFRSMQSDAEDKTGAVWAIENDQRRTGIGKILRSTSIDELPQLWNVFVGNMSLVGPRPERPVFVDKFRHEIPNYMLRHRVKTGITGWAQINGWRGDTSLEKRIECDIYYIRNWSLWLDFKILFLTVFKGFVNPNAY